MMEQSAINTLMNLGYTYHGGELWKPPIGEAPDFDLIDSLRVRIEALEKDAARYRWLREGANDEVAVVRGLGAMDYGMSVVVSTYLEEIDGDDLDAAIDTAMQSEKGGV